MRQMLRQRQMRTNNIRPTILQTKPNEYEPRKNGKKMSYTTDKVIDEYNSEQEELDRQKEKEKK